MVSSADVCIMVASAISLVLSVLCLLWMAKLKIRGADRFVKEGSAYVFWWFLALMALGFLLFVLLPEWFGFWSAWRLIPWAVLALICFGGIAKMYRDSN